MNQWGSESEQGWNCDIYNMDRTNKLYSTISLLCYRQDKQQEVCTPLSKN